MSEGPTRARPTQARRKRNWALRLIGWLLALLFLGVIGVAAVFFIGYATVDIPDPNKDFQTNTSFIYYSGGEAMGQVAEQNRISVPLEQVPKYVQNAHIAAEDRTFWTNPGVEPTAMIRAGWNIARGQDLQGGSTITQQYVKLMYLNQERTFTRKFNELFISVKLSRDDDKATILENYLNTIYYGRGAYGIRAAGKAFFNRENPKDLTLGESAMLATILNNPTAFDPDNPKNQKRILDRYRYVLDGMRQQGTITASQEATLRKALPKVKPERKNRYYNGPNGFLLSMAKRQLEEEVGLTPEQIAGGGYRVTTTFDQKLQKQMIEAIAEGRPETKKGGLQIGAASVKPGTGELVAMYGGADFLDPKNQINWATSRARPGSSFKPFALAAALKDGINLRKTFQGDSPIYIGGKPFNNEFNNDYGRVNLVKATEESVNTAYYDLIDNEMEDGVNKLVDMAEATGIPKSKEIEHDREVGAPATVLGPNPYASPVDMANAYATFAANGKYTAWHVIKEVRKPDGTPLYTAKPETRQAMDEDVAADVNATLQRVVRSGTGTRARDLGRPVGGKTGTAGGTSIEKNRANAKCKAKDYKGCKMKEEGDDTLTSWWAGYTPQYSTAVVYRAGKEGESDLDPYSSDPAFFGGRYPLQTWLEFMKSAHDGLKEEDFPESSGKNRIEPSDDVTPSRTPRRTPTNEPSRAPSRTPTGEPSRTPTNEPSRTPTDEPTKTPPSTKPTKTPPTKPPITLPTSPGVSAAAPPSGAAAAPG